ncbi:hypothetical protein CBR_g50669 [Chara braunii]|uniref:DDE Tnp4 domain-containing protein n=1 Tax=Chara braunii TaxID=69332 RepID=A0A388M7J1_CHABU|nr:hypothetical protein CBR_g50669 [Chara braunii]|eukprot:GBG90422.1 hypothetical protein CBR_g50669 [Chara braunii]
MRVTWVREQMAVMCGILFIRCMTQIIMMRKMTAIQLLLAHVSLAEDGHAILGLPPLPRPRRQRFWVRHRAGGTWEELNMVGPEHDKKFREYTRLTRPIFQRIVDRISPRIQRLNTSWRQALPASMKFAFTLYRWARGGSYRQCGNDFGMGLHSVVRCTENVSTALLAHYGDTVRWSTGACLETTLEYFEGKGFPRCFGVIDCTHVYLDKPRNGRAEAYYNRNRHYSIVAQVVCDENLRILDVCVGASGSVRDSRVLRVPDLYSSAEERRAPFTRRTNVLQDGTVRAGVEIRAPFTRRTNVLQDGTVMGRYLMRDAGYPVLPWLMTPYSAVNRTAEQVAFNNKFSALRCVIERCFGRLKGMWRCFGRKHIVNMRNVCKQFLACCILDNIIIDEGIPVDEELLWRQADEDEESDGDDDAPESDDSGGDDDPPDGDFDIDEALLRCEGSFIYASHRQRHRVAERLREAIHAHSDHVARVFR